MIQTLLSVSLLLAGASAAAQDTAPFNPVDASRDLRAETRASAGGGDFTMARRTNGAALVLQPGHPGLLNNAVILAGMAGDLPAQLDALAAIADAGLLFDPAALDTAEALRTLDAGRFAGIEARLAANAAPEGSAERLVTVALADSLIEAVEIDIETERLFLGGIADRTIHVLEHGSDRPRVFADASDGLWSVSALAVDSRNRLLYAASGVVPQTPLGEGEAPGTALFAFDLVTGDLMVRHEIEGAGRIADLTVRDGIVYASDGEAPRVYRLDGPLAELEVLAEDARFSSLQGLVVTSGAVYVADYGLGVWRIDPAAGTARLAASPAESLIGLDALALAPDGSIFAVRNGAAPMGVLRLTLDRDGDIETAGPVLTGHPAFAENTEPTTLQIADGRAFLLANAQWALFPVDGSTPEAERQPVTILTWRVD